MDNPISPDSVLANVTEPFTLVALARQDLTTGEIVHFDVDSAGNITSPNFLFLPTNPRVSKISGVTTATVASGTSTTQVASTTSDPDQGTSAPRNTTE
jgi:hypothetical protein